MSGTQVDDWAPVGGASAPADDWAPVASGGTVVVRPDVPTTNDWSPTTATSVPGPVPQYTGWDRGLRLGGSALAKGAVSLLGLPGDIEHLANAGLGYLGVPDRYRVNALPTSADMVGVTDRMGLTNRPELTPTGAVERVGTTLLGAMPGAALGVAHGMKQVPSIIASGAGALAPDAVDAVSPDSSPLAKGALAVGASLLGGNVASAVDNVVTSRAAQRSVTQAAEALDQAKTAQRALEDAQFGAKNSAALVRDAAKKQDLADHRVAIANIDQQLHNDSMLANAQIAQTRGPAASAEEAGTAIQQSIRQHLATTADQIDAHMQPFLDAVPPGTPILGENLRRIVGQQSSPTGQAGFDAMLSRMAPSPVRDMLTSLRADGGALMNSLDMQSTNELRRRVGALAGSPGVVGTQGEKDLRQLYAGLTDDMRQGAAALPPVQVNGLAVRPDELFDTAMRRVDQLHAFNSNVAAKLVKSTDPVKDSSNPALVPAAMLRMSGADLAELRARVPDAIDPAFRAALTPQQGRALPTWDKLAPEVQQAIAPTPQAAQELTQWHGQLGDLAEQARIARQAANDALQAAKARTAPDVAGQVADTTAKRSAQQTTASAKDAHDRAVAALAELASRHSNATGALGALAGGHLGHDLGTLAAHAFPHFNSLEGGALGSVAGFMAPRVFRGTAGTLLSPQDMGYVGLGMVGATPGIADAANRQGR